MANNVNLGVADIVRAAIQHTNDNGFTFTNLGAMRALRSPQVGQLREAVSVANPANAGNLSRVQGATAQDIIHRLKLNYMQQTSNATGRDTRVVSDNMVANPGILSMDFDYNLRREFDVTFDTAELIEHTEQTRAYMAAITAGVSSGNIGNMSGLALVGIRIFQMMESELLIPMNDKVLTALIAGIGKNQLTNSLVAKEIPILGPDLNPRPDFFWEEINTYRTMMKIQGIPIVVGGAKFLSFMMREKIMSAASAIGVNFQLAARDLPIEWYYDPMIDTKLGAGNFIMFDPGAACLEELVEHGPNGVVKQAHVARTDYTNGAINITQHIQESNFVLKTDVRMRENDATAYPTFKITTGLLGGVFTRPPQMKKTYEGAGVTGIVKFKLVDRPTV